MAIDKSLYEAPMGLGALDEEEPMDIQVVLTDDEGEDIGI